MSIEFIILSWYTLSVGIICYQESKVGWPQVPYRKLIPFLLYHMVISTIQLLYVIPLWFIMSRVTHRRFVWNQVAWNFGILLPIWWGPIKWKGLKYVVPSRQAIWLGNHQSVLDTAIMTLLPCQTDMVGTSKDSIKYIPGGGLMALMCGTIFVEKGSPTIRCDFRRECMEALSNGLSLNIFPQGTRRHISAGVLPLKRGAFEIAHEMNVHLQPYTIVYNIGKDIVVTIHPPVEVVGREIDDTLNDVYRIFS